MELPILKVSAPELVSGISGESEQKLRELFEQAVVSALLTTLKGKHFMTYCFIKCGVAVFWKSIIKDPTILNKHNYYVINTYCHYLYAVFERDLHE